MEPPTVAHPFIIGLGHRKRTGKDTFARYLKEALMDEGVKSERRAFASSLRSIAHLLWGWLGVDCAAAYESEVEVRDREIPLPTINKSPRQLWIELGIKIREIWPDTWLSLALNEPTPASVIIVTDVRFPNECEAIKARGGILIKMERDTQASADVADDALATYTGWNIIIHNNGDLDRLRRIASGLSRGIRKVTQHGGSLYFPVPENN